MMRKAHAMCLLVDRIMWLHGRDHIDRVPGRPFLSGITEGLE